MLCKIFPSVSSVVLNINILQSIEVKNSGIMTTLVSGPINLQQSGPDKRFDVQNELFNYHFYRHSGLRRLFIY